MLSMVFLTFDCYNTRQCTFFKVICVAQMNDITTKQVISLWDTQVGGFLPDRKEDEEIE